MCIARHKPSELYCREYDQGKVTYNDISRNGSDQLSSFFLPGSCQDWSRFDTNKHREDKKRVSINKCHEHILLIIFIIDLHIFFIY